MNILVAGGAGYIGTHTCVSLIEAGHEVIVVDNLSNSKLEAVKRVERITNHKIKFYEIDLCSYEDSRIVFEENKIDGIIHFAGLKAVAESVKMPLEYYKNNLDSTFTLIRLMREYNVKNLVFSSSATVYGTPEELPLKEVLSDNSKNDPLHNITVDEDYKELLNKIKNDLSESEYEVFKLMLMNKNYLEISDILDKSPKQIDNTMQRIKSKIKKILETTGD